MLKLPEYPITFVVALMCGAALAPLASLALAQTVSAQTYPARTVRIISTEPGGSLDLAARILAQGLGAAFGQSVIVENRPGAAGIIAVEALKSAPADGYAVGFYSSAFWITPLMQSVPYDPKDFAPVVMAVSSPNVVVVHPSLPVKSVKELIALAKARPGEFSYGASSTGSGPHLAGELFKAMTGVNIVRIPYRVARQRPTIWLPAACSLPSRPRASLRDSSRPANCTRSP